MKYFTPELWSKVGSPDKQEREAAHTEWAKNAKEYSLIFDKIKNRLPKKFLKVYFENKGFNDFRLIGFSLSQTIDKKGNPQSVKIDIETPFDKKFKTKRFRITYKQPSIFEVRYSDEQGCNGFDDYGYNEFLPVDERTLSQEILFASGATVLIHFKDKNISVEDLDH